MAESKSDEYEFVIIGGGVAGGYAVNEFVNHGVTGGRICLISSEEVLPYERPALTKGFLMGKAKHPDFNTCAANKATHLQDWYDTNGIRVLLNTTVVEINWEKKELMIKSTKQEEKDIKVIAYGKLLLATGASAIQLSDFKMEGSDLKGIYYLRGYQDGLKLLHAIENVTKTGGNVVIIGGGYIGLEVTAALISQGVKKMTMIFPEEHLMKSTLFTKDMAAFYEELYASKGVTFIKGGKCKSFSGKSGHVSHVHLDNGDPLPADLVIVGVGARPNTQLFEKKLEMKNRGALVNGQMQTSVSDVYACGDIATFPCLFTRSLLRLEHVRHARASAIHAVKVMIGKEKNDYDFLPAFYSRILDKAWAFYGEQAAGADIHIIGDFKPKLMVIWSVKNNICGIFVESVTENEEKLVQELVRKRVNISNLKLSDQKNVSEFLELMSKL